VPNTYAGPTLIEAGALSVTADDRLGQAGADVILNGGILLAADGFTLGSVRDLWLGYGADGTGTVQVASNTLTYAGVVADYPGGVGTLSKTGAGTLLLEGANTFSGAAFVQAGTLALGHDNAAGAGWVRLGAGTLATAGGARTLTNTVAVNAIGTFDTSAGDLILMGALTNNSTGDPRKAGEGSLVLRGGMTFAGGAGWDILRGLMVMDGSAGVVADDGYRISAEDGVLAGLVLTNGGSLTLGTSGGTPNLRLGNTSTTGTNVVVVAGGDLAFGERAVELILTYAANTTNLVRQSAGTVRWTGTNVAAGINMAFAAGGYSVYQLDGGLLSVPRIRQTAATGNGWFHFNGGTVSPSTNLNASTFMVGLTAALVQDGGAHFDTAGLDITVGQALLNGGSGGLAKSGAGRLTLTNVSTYVGPTRVLGGTLALTGSGSVASSTLLTISSGAVLDVAGVTGGFPLAAGQTLGGGGAVAGVVQVNPGATVAPGDGLGVLTLSNAPILNGTVDLQVRRSGGSLSSDTLVVFGTLSFGGELRVTVASGSDALQNGDVFNLFDAGAFAGTFASFNLPALPAGLEWDGSQLGVDGTLRVAASAGGGNRVAVADLSDGTLRLTYEGTPGTAYALERATNLGASALWVPLSTNVVPGSGLLLFTNTPLPPATFYRTRRVP
jgi:autotransporter-associated beta strand protein